MTNICSGEGEAPGVDLGGAGPEGADLAREAEGGAEGGGEGEAAAEGDHKL